MIQGKKPQQEEITPNSKKESEMSNSSNSVLKYIIEKLHDKIEVAMGIIANVTTS
ncbi:hypothetical protein [Borreliella valaisiana]|uniref:hypothetical protein n=1 Tax=Borreliella valaisiana TaxID=62088 RepID=UPI002ED20ADC|nr:hypothetical protein KJD09_05050 [Borreliella valaisiana]